LIILFFDDSKVTITLILILFFNHLVYLLGAWHIIEPIMKVEVACPYECGGGIMSSLSKRNGIIAGTDESHGFMTVMAEVPLNDMFGFATEMRVITQGKGEYTMEYARYSPARREVQKELAEAYQESEAQAKRN